MRELPAFRLPPEEDRACPPEPWALQALRGDYNGLPTGKGV